MLFKFNNCKCVECNKDLTKKIYLQISYNWKTIECDNCKRINFITLPSFSYNSIAYGFPIGVLCGFIWYIDSFSLVIKLLCLFVLFLIFMMIYILILVKKITLY